jgi:hypothetical protein
VQVDLAGGEPAQREHHDVAAGEALLLRGPRVAEDGEPEPLDAGGEPRKRVDQPVVETRIPAGAAHDLHHGEVFRTAVEAPDQVHHGGDALVQEQRCRAEPLIEPLHELVGDARSHLQQHFALVAEEVLCGTPRHAGSRRHVARPQACVALLPDDADDGLDEAVARVAPPLLLRAACGRSGSSALAASGAAHIGGEPNTAVAGRSSGARTPFEQRDDQAQQVAQRAAIALHALASRGADAGTLTGVREQRRDPAGQLS